MVSTGMKVVGSVTSVITPRVSVPAAFAFGALVLPQKEMVSLLISLANSGKTTMTGLCLSSNELSPEWQAYGYPI